MTWAARIACLFTNVAVAAIVMVLTITHYEGIPILRGLPLLGRLASGVIETRIASATADLVNVAEVVALKAQLDRERRNRLAILNAYREDTKRAAAEAEAREQDIERLRKMVAEDNGDDGAVWTDNDLRWLQRH